MATRNPFMNLLAFMIGTLFIVGLAFAAYIAVQRGVVALPPAQLTVDGAAPARRVAPATDLRPAFVSPAPQAQPPAAPAQAQPAAPVYQPAGNDAPAPAEAVPAGAPMSEEYQATIRAQQRTNAAGEVCAPRSGCTRPGSGGPQPGPVGAP